MTALIVLVLGAALAWHLTARHRRRAPEHGLRLVSRAGLTQRAGLALVEIDRRRLLIGYGDGAPTLLADWPAPPVVLHDEDGEDAP